MLRICDLGKHLFDDGLESSYSKEESLTKLRTSEQVACKECWDKFSQQVSDTMKKINVKGGECFENCLRLWK